MSECTALVPFIDDEQEDISRPLNAFKRKLLTIDIDGRAINIEQQWNRLGVAGVVWDSAILLATYLATHPQLIVNKSVVELGAGTGLPSIVAINAQAVHVTATDMPQSLKLLTANIGRNVDASADYSVLPLVWNETSTHLQTFDIILGADLVYDEMVFDDLRNMLRMLSNDQTIIFISGRIRYDRDRRFYADLKNDFDVHEIEYDQRTDVRLFKMTRLQY